MSDFGECCDSKKPIEDDDIIESDIDLDNTDVVEPDNDPPQKMGDPAVEVTEEKRDATQAEKAKVMDAISKGNLDEAIDHLTEAIMLNPISTILNATRASIFVKLKKPHATIRDVDAALVINPDFVEGYKVRGMTRAMLGQQEQAANELQMASKLDYDDEIGLVLKKVEPNAHKIEEYHIKYELLQKERELRKTKRERKHEAEPKKEKPYLF
ncbi:PREDICTED: TPR repeat-containing thioredoxin TDX-like [Populus euphratica]|uniref:TPR repeat-containing thioredoxin TDX-like n=1 Tax=Populus euphratica TaxID=75702 RepID=A0AAJ6V088_POPEU|nr:PREDICTED: TPR repeat-containing thioredoxin TDX-like [Populus euphratica]XP_011039180.1 PREDICTED: TPR repeat-containing thioredoxin TDX-like [Populus euphratica]XP_011039181.1 PREDICTED: TPR repeat-containing thioredoxin TDX-like [Populus euphratica]